MKLMPFHETLQSNNGRNPVRAQREARNSSSIKRGIARTIALFVLLNLAACQTYTGVQSNCWAKVTQGPLDPDCFNE